MYHLRGCDAINQVTGMIPVICDNAFALEDNLRWHTQPSAAATSMTSCASSSSAQLTC